MIIVSKVTQKQLRLVHASGFLELLNNMITTGIVPALHGDDEKESIISSVTPGHLFLTEILQLPVANLR